MRKLQNVYTAALNVDQNEVSVDSEEQKYVKNGSVIDKDWDQMVNLMKDIGPICDSDFKQASINKFSGTKNMPEI